MIVWQKAPDVKKRFLNLIKKTDINWLKTEDIYFYRSTSAQTRACARIWGLSRLWQRTLKKNPSYIVEVISERFDKLGETEKDKILLHEINHIPRNFSGALVPHIRRGKRSFHAKLKKLYENYHSARRLCR